MTVYYATKRRECCVRDGAVYFTARYVAMRRGSSDEFELHWLGDGRGVVARLDDFGTSVCICVQPGRYEHTFDIPAPPRSDAPPPQFGRVVDAPSESSSSSSSLDARLQKATEAVGDVRYAVDGNGRLLAVTHECTVVDTNVRDYTLLRDGARYVLHTDSTLRRGGRVLARGVSRMVASEWRDAVRVTMPDHTPRHRTFPADKSVDTTTRTRRCNFLPVGDDTFVRAPRPRCVDAEAGAIRCGDGSLVRFRAPYAAPVSTRAIDVCIVCAASFSDDTLDLVDDGARHLRWQLVHRHILDVPCAAASSSSSVPLVVLHHMGRAASVQWKGRTHALKAEGVFTFIDERRPYIFRDSGRPDCVYYGHRAFPASDDVQDVSRRGWVATRDGRVFAGRGRVMVLRVPSTTMLRFVGASRLVAIGATSVRVYHLERRRHAVKARADDAAGLEHNP